MRERLYLTDLMKVNPSKEANDNLWEVSYTRKDTWNILNEEKRNTGAVVPQFIAGCKAWGASHELASLIEGTGGRWWHHSQSSFNKVLTVAYFDNLGFLDSYDLNFSNRPVRTRMPGGVGGACPLDVPYPDQKEKLLAKI
ncbi:MAG TPA: hypothetical protein DCP92_11645 [Nitrospiraceae bacterium]|jgi:hypothetical protein|nr:hypothetical protein [Nitrospiraceae bacterium]